MNPADQDSVHRELGAQAGAIRQIEQQLTVCGEAFQDATARHNRQMEDITEELRYLRTASAASSPPIHAAPISTGADAQLTASERFSGAPGTCRSFLIICTLTFEMHPHKFPSERSRVAYMVTQLTGRARDWGTAEWEKQSAVCASVSAFS